MNGAAGASVSRDNHLDRLDSWKEIAGYLRRSITTVQRWEREERLPVHRHQHDSLGSVYAFRRELEAWRVKRAVRSDTDDQLTFEGANVSGARRITAWQRAILRVSVLLAAAAVGAVAVQLATPSPPKLVRRLTILPLSTAPIVTNGIDRNLTITPDGTRIVYVGGMGAPKLFVRALDQIDTIEIAAALSRKLRHRGGARVNWTFIFTAAVFNLVRMRTLLTQPA